MLKSYAEKQAKLIRNARFLPTATGNPAALAAGAPINNAGQQMRVVAGSLVPVQDQQRVQLGARLLQVVQSGSLAEVRSVLDMKASPTSVLIPRGQNLVFYAATRESGAYEVCKLLVERHVPADLVDQQMQQTALFFAVRTSPELQGVEGGGPQCAAYLIEQGCDVNHQDRQQQTALFYAARRRSSDCLDLLLQKQADVNLRDRGQLSAVTYALLANSLPCLQALITAGADVVSPAIQGVSTLCFCRDPAAVKIILDCECDVNQKDDLGKSPVCAAAQTGSVSVVQAM